MEELMIILVLVSILTFLAGIVWGRRMKDLENKSKIIPVQNIEGWIARNGEAAGGGLYLYSDKPSAPDKDSIYEDDKVAWGVRYAPYEFDRICELDSNLFQDITFENSPVRVKLFIQR